VNIPELEAALKEDWGKYGFEAHQGRAVVRTRTGQNLRLHVGTNHEGEPTLTVYIDHGRTHVKAKVLLDDFTQALNTAIRTAP
jgi:hypothetical protein